MKVSKTHEVSFLNCGASGHLFAVRPGVSVDAALSCTASFLDTAHELLLAAEEIDSAAARVAATWLIEMAEATLEAGRPAAPER